MASFKALNNKVDDPSDPGGQDLAHDLPAVQPSRLPVIMDSKAHHEENIQDSIEVRDAEINRSAFVLLQDNRARGRALPEG